MIGACSNWNDHDAFEREFVQLLKGLRRSEVSEVSEVKPGG